MGQKQEASTSYASILPYVLPAMVYVIWLVAVLTWGGVALHDNTAISDNQACGKSTHMIKYVSVNLIFTSCVFISYLLYPGAGEGARARATLLLAVHGALAVWGVLLWTSVDGVCQLKLCSIFPGIVLFEHVCIAHNSVFFVMFLLHESFLGEYLGFDFTLLPEKKEVGIKEPGARGVGSTDFTKNNEEISIPPADNELGMNSDNPRPMWMAESAVPAPAIHNPYLPKNHSGAANANYPVPRTYSQLISREDDVSPPPVI